MTSSHSSLHWATNLCFSLMLKVRNLFPQCWQLWGSTQAALLRIKGKNKHPFDFHQKPWLSYLPSQKFWISTKNLTLQFESKKISLQTKLVMLKSSLYLTLALFVSVTQYENSHLLCIPAKACLVQSILPIVQGLVHKCRKNWARYWHADQWTICNNIKAAWVCFNAETKLIL